MHIYTKFKGAELYKMRIRYICLNETNELLERRIGKVETCIKIHPIYSSDIL